MKPRINVRNIVILLIFLLSSICSIALVIFLVFGMYQHRLIELERAKTLGKIEMLEYGGQMNVVKKPANPLEITVNGCKNISNIIMLDITIRNKAEAKARYSRYSFGLKDQNLMMCESIGDTSQIANRLREILKKSALNMGELLGAESVRGVIFFRCPDQAVKKFTLIFEDKRINTSVEGNIELRGEPVGDIEIQKYYTLDEKRIITDKAEIDRYSPSELRYKDKIIMHRFNIIETDDVAPPIISYDMLNVIHSDKMSVADALGEIEKYVLTESGKYQDIKIYDVDGIRIYCRGEPLLRGKRCYFQDGENLIVTNSLELAIAYIRGKLKLSEVVEKTEPSHPLPQYLHQDNFQGKISKPKS